LIKCFAVSRALHQAGIAEEVIYTWQHYDETLFSNLYREFGFSWQAPAEVADKTPRGLHALFRNIENQAAALTKQPALVLVYGDTDSTLAGSLFAKAKGLPLVHVEAGERSFNADMPEEMNRVVTDRLSNFLFCVNAKAARNLAAEGINGDVVVTGDVMLDTLLHFKTKLEQNEAGVDPLLRQYAGLPFIYFTLHRAANTASQAIFNRILNAIGALNSTVLWPVHPRCASLLAGVQLPANIVTLPPASYTGSVYLLQHCQAVITDSGGLQKEAWWMRKKCITLREETEWTETLDGNCNILETQPAAGTLTRKMALTPDWSNWSLQPFGGGSAATVMAAHLKRYVAPAAAI
jgi:UDP-GlcNAc3NAcA epimerase